MKNFEIRYDEGRKKESREKGVKIGPKRILTSLAYEYNFIGLRI